MKSKIFNQNSSPYKCSMQQLRNVHVVRRDLVYIVGLPGECENESILSSNQWFGRFGEINKIKINTKNSRPNSLAAHIQFCKEDDALNAIQSLNGFYLHHNDYHSGTQLKASFGCNRFCLSFLNNQACNQSNCGNLHYWVNEKDFIYSKNELSFKNEHIPMHIHEHLSVPKLSLIRLVQKDEIFIPSLTPDLHNVPKLESNEFFGRFGKIKRIKLSVSSKKGNLEARVAYYKECDALSALNYMNGYQLPNGDRLVVKNGENKYCNSFMQREVCYDSCCPFIHRWAPKPLILTKIHNVYHRNDIQIMEQLRYGMEIIAQNEKYSFNLDLLSDHYYFYTKTSIRRLYQGKLKQLVLYFNDIFKVTLNRSSVFIQSKIFKINKQNDTFTNQNDTNQMSIELSNRCKELQIKCNQETNEMLKYKTMYNDVNDKLSVLRDKYSKLLAKSKVRSPCKPPIHTSNHSIQLLIQKHDSLKLKYDQQTKYNLKRTSEIKKYKLMYLNAKQYEKKYKILQSQNNALKKQLEDINDNKLIKKEALDLDTSSNSNKEKNKNKNKYKFNYWLTNIVALKQYLELFRDNEYDDYSMIEFYDEEMLLNELGIKKLHCKLIMKRVTNFQKMHIAFSHLLDTNSELKRFKHQFAQNGILTLNDLRSDIKTKYDVKTILKIENESEISHYLSLIQNSNWSNHNHHEGIIH